MPAEFIAFLQDLHTMCSDNKNPIVAWGLSRGGRWLEELARQHSRYLDAAVIIGGYPESRDQWQQKEMATELIRVKKPIVCMVHYVADEFCGADKYSFWHAEFALVMERLHRGEFHDTGFMSFMLPGTHKYAGELFHT